MNLRSRTSVNLSLMAFVSCLVVSSCAQPAASQPVVIRHASAAALAVKVFTSDAGIYTIDTAALSSACLDITHPTALCLTWQGQPYPFWFADAENAPSGNPSLLFYAPDPISMYSPHNIFWVWADCDNASPFASLKSTHLERAGLLSSVSAGIARFYFEENHLSSPLPQTGDHWFWETLSAPGQRQWRIPLDHLASGEAILQVEVWGQTFAPVEPDHQAQLYVNGRLVLDERWEGSGWHTLKASVPTGILKNGQNQVTLELPGLPEVPAEVVMLNSLSLDAPRQLRAVAGKLAFTTVNPPQVLAGLKGPGYLYDTSTLHAGSVWQYPKGGKFVFNGEPGHTYLAVDATSLHQPDWIESARLATEHYVPNNQVAVLVIAPEAFLPELSAYATWRQQHGQTVFIAELEDIFDEFNAGYPEPQAILAFLQTVMQWQEPPEALLLVGDASEDAWGYLSTPPDPQLPTFTFYSIYGGQTATDLPYADPDGDGQVDLAVGRIPARTPQQMRVLVEKIITFEQQILAVKRPVSTLAVADGQDSLFNEDARAFLGDFYGGEEQLLVPEAGDTQAHLVIQQALQSQPLFVAYFGHGGLTMWGKDRLLSIEDVTQAERIDDLPVILQFTCLSGSFSHPAQQSLAEAMLWQPGGGAVATLAPTSLSLPADQRVLIEALSSALNQPDNKTLGQALLAVWRSLNRANPGVMDVMQSFLLLGDPALVIKP